MLQIKAAKSASVITHASVVPIPPSSSVRARPLLYRLTQERAKKLRLRNLDGERSIGNTRILRGLKSVSAAEVGDSRRVTSMAAAISGSSAERDPACVTALPGFLLRLNAPG